MGFLDEPFDEGSIIEATHVGFQEDTILIGVPHSGRYALVVGGDSWRVCQVCSFPEAATERCSGFISAPLEFTDLVA
jgi:hypothetical protein